MSDRLLTINSRFEIHSCIGQGGIGIVYKATDRESNKLVALKLLFPERVPDAQSVARFQREATAASLLDHPCLTKVYESGITDSGQPYLVMELVEGTTLAAKIAQEGQLSIDETLKIFIQVCDGLAHAHERKILHRDLKPSNIMLTTSGDSSLGVKILDFGLAKIQRPPDKETLHITQTGQLVGSPFYMSPEQARGVGIDHRSDLYSLGCSLYEALTGGPPHVGQSPMSTLLKRETDPPLSLTEGSLGRSFPQHVDRVVVRLLDLDPDRRYQSASEVKEALLNLLNGKGGEIAPNPPAIAKSNAPNDKGKYLVCGAAILLAAASAFAHHSFNQIKGSQVSKEADKKQLSEVQPPKRLHLPDEWPASGLADAKQIRQAQELRKIGEYDQSAQILKKTIATYRQSYGRGSAVEADAFQELAETNIAAEKTDEAYDALDNAFRISKKLSPASGGRLADLTVKAADLYAQPGQNDSPRSSDRAIELYERAATLYEHLSPPRTLQQGNCLLEKGRLLVDAKGAYTKGEEALKKAVTLFNVKPITRPGHLLAARRWLSACFRRQKRLVDACDYDLQTLDLIQKLSEDRRLDRCITLNQLGFDYFCLGAAGDKENLKTAESFYNKSLDLSAKYPKEMYGQRIQTLEGLGDVYAQQITGRRSAYYDRAKENYLKAVAMCRNDVRPRELNTKYEKLGHLEMHTDHMQKQLEYFDLALKSPGEDVRRIALEQLQIASAYRRKSKFLRAEAICKQLIAAAERLFGRESVNCADARAELGRCYLDEKKTSEAKDELERALAIYRKALGPDHEKTKSTLTLLSNAGSSPAGDGP